MSDSNFLQSFRHVHFHLTPFPFFCQKIKMRKKSFASIKNYFFYKKITSWGENKIWNDFSCFRIAEWKERKSCWVNIQLMLGFFTIFSGKFFLTWPIIEKLKIIFGWESADFYNSSVWLFSGDVLIGLGVFGPLSGQLNWTALMFLKDFSELRWL